jgi:large subunit ribosomal protein L27
VAKPARMVVPLEENLSASRNMEVNISINESNVQLGEFFFLGELVIPGNIIVRQRGTQFHPGTNVGIGRDHTLYSLVTGYVKFDKQTVPKPRHYIHVFPKESEAALRPFNIIQIS